MRKYRSNAGSEVRVRYGVELIEGLRLFPETSMLAESFLSQNNQLEQLYSAREKLERASTAYSARVRFADYTWDQVVRSLTAALQLADGGQRHGALYRALFDDGLAAVVAPSGIGQIKACAAFIQRFEASKAAGIDEVRDAWLPKLKKAHQDLVDAVAGRTKAFEEVAAARAVEDAARDDHELGLEKIMGHVRMLFPKDRRRWKTIFPRNTSASSYGDLDDDEVPETDG